MKYVIEVIEGKDDVRFYRGGTDIVDNYMDNKDIEPRYTRDMDMASRFNENDADDIAEIISNKGNIGVSIIEYDLM